jgi:TolB-like protein/Tfp pilus assembly protein PilF/predicted Ser/Thr protein kinase
MPIQPRQMLSHYRLVKKIGEGGMGVVWKAEDTVLKRDVALKILPEAFARDPQRLARFEKEARFLAALNHPNIAAIHGLEESEGRRFLILELVPGESLAERLGKRLPSVEQSLTLCCEIARALEAAHGKGVIHRDLKPGNVQVTTEGQVKVLDFGLAKAFGAASEADEMAAQSTVALGTGQHVVLGTTPYMSPEQASGGTLDKRTDIWSFGCILYELLTGQRAFAGETVSSTVAAIHGREPEWQSLPAETPPRIRTLLQRCLAKDPDRRLHDIADARIEIGEALSEAAAAPPAAVAIEPPRPVRSRRLAWAVIVTVIAALVVVAGYFVWPRFGASRAPSTGRIMLAVLPFENLGAPDDEYFADGMTEEITSRLAVVPDLGVISRSSAKQYKGTTKGLREIGKELGVDYVLEGTVRWDRAGDNQRVRITPQLVNVANDVHLWAANYEREISEIFAVQADIAAQTAEALNITLLESDRQAMEARPTENLDAYQAYLRGLDYYGRLPDLRDNAQRAEEMFDRAVELDPEFALGYAQLSKNHSGFYHFGYDATEARLAQAKVAVDKALELQPELPEAHVALGFYYYWGHREYDRALQEFAIAEKSLSNNSEILTMLGAIRRRQGDFETGLQKLDQAFELSPQDAAKARELAITYTHLRRYADAERYLDRAISLGPDSVQGYVWRARNYRLWQGDLKKARDVLEKMPKSNDDYVMLLWFNQWLFEKDYPAILDFASATSRTTLTVQQWLYPIGLLSGIAYHLMGEPELAHASYDSARAVLENEMTQRPDDHRIHSALGLAYAGLGRKAEAIREGKRGVELVPVSNDAVLGPYRVRDLAMIYARVGEQEAALDQIEYVLSIPGDFSVQSLRLDPRWDPLRDHPRFKALLEKYGD